VLPDFLVKNTKTGRNIPNCHKIFPMAVKQTKWSSNIQRFYNANPKYILIGIFWFENKTIWQP
jgi:hypothetical protein